jgi:GNAT superfamily N-acetyltransferase
MNTVQQQPAGAAPDITIRSFRESDVDFVISRQLALYESEYGFTSEIWRAYLTGGVHDFVNGFDNTRNCMYILENNGVPSGCVAIAHADGATAQLRFFFLEPGVRGRGAGHTLLDMAVEFCKEKGYGRVFLWTFSTLMAARHLYAGKGFRITETRENNEWGEPILEECWNLDLSCEE